MVVDHGPIKYLISKIRYDEQESPKPNSTYLESYLRQHEENKPRLYLRRSQGLESLHSIHDGAVNPFFKDDLKDKDGVYIYDSEEDITVQEEEKKDEDDFEIRSFVDSNDLETIRKYRNTNFIITRPLVGPRKFRREKASSCQRRNKRIQAEVQDINVICAADAQTGPESEVADESLEDVVMKKYEEKEEEFGEKVKVDTWKGHGVKRICLCNTKKYKVVKGKFGNKSVKIKLTVNRNTRNSAESKQKKKICLCNLAKRIIKTTAELTSVQNKEGLTQTLTGVLDTLNVNDNVMSNEEPKVTVSSTKVVDPTDVEQIEAGQKILLSKKRKKNVSVKVIKKAFESVAMVNAQTEILDSIEDDKKKLQKDDDIRSSDATINALCEEQDQEKAKRSGEILEYVKEGIQKSFDDPQDLQVYGDAAKVAHQDKVDDRRSTKRRKQVCLCNRKIKNVAIKITRVTASGWATETGDSIGLKEEEKVEKIELDRSRIEAEDLKGLKETKKEEYLPKSKSKRKKSICLCERRMKSVTIKIIRRTSEPYFNSPMKHLHVIKRQHINNLKVLGYKKKFGQHKLKGGNVEDISKMKKCKKKKKVCFCDSRLESIDEEIHIKEEIPGSTDDTDSIGEQIQTAKASESGLPEILNPAEGPEKIEDQSQANILSTEVAQNSLQEIFPAEGPGEGTEEQLQANMSSIEVDNNDTVEEQPQEGNLVTGPIENGLQERIEAAKESARTEATSQANISAATADEHGLQDIQFSSKMVGINGGNETHKTTMIKTQSTKKEKNYLSKDRKLKKILINTDNLSMIELNKIPEQLKLESEADVENISKVRKSKQSKKVCFREEPLKKEILGEAYDDASNNQDGVDESNIGKFKLRRKERSADKRQAEDIEEEEIVIRERYVGEFSYEKYQEIQEFVDEILEGLFIKCEETHRTQEKKYLVDLFSKRVSAGKVPDKVEGAKKVKCIQKQCKGTVNGKTSTHSERPETMNTIAEEPNKDSISDRRVKQKKKTCRCDCNCPETAFCNRPSLIGLIGSDELLSACNEQECKNPDVRQCKETEYKVFHVSELKPIIEQPNEEEEEDKPDDRNHKTRGTNSIIEKYKSNTGDTGADREKKTRGSISNCYKDAICNRLSSVILLDPVKHSTQGIGQIHIADFAKNLSDERTLDQNTQTKEKTFIKKQSFKCTSNDKVLKRKNVVCRKPSLIRLLDSDEHLSANTEHINEVLKKGTSKDASKRKQKGPNYEKQGSWTQNIQTNRSSLSVPLHSNKCLSSGTEHIGRPSDARDIEYIIEECKENKFVRKSSNQDTQAIRPITKQLSKSISNHKISDQRKKICISNRNFEKGVFNKPPISGLLDPCDHFPVYQMKPVVGHPSEDILDDRISRKPKQRRFTVERIAKCITDAENQLTKPFRKMFSYTENAINIGATMMKLLGPEQYLASNAKKMNKMYDTRDSKNLSRRTSSQVTQGEKINIVAEQPSTEITSGRVSNDQQRKICESNCQFEEKKVPNRASSIISDNSKKQLIHRAKKSRTVFNLSDTSDTKRGNLAKRRLHQDTRTNKTNKDFTNDESSVHKMKLCINNCNCEGSGMWNSSSLADLNDPGAFLALTTDPVSNMSNSTRHKSDIEYHILDEGPSYTINELFRRA